MDGEREEVLAQLMSIASIEADRAQELLQATDFNLEEALNLFFSGGLDAAAGGTAAAPPGPAGGDDASEALARRLQQEAEAEASEREVRAADAVRTERLYDEHHLRALQREATSVAAPPQAMDAFRDFGAEAAEENSGSAPVGLAEMFKPPKDLAFVGTWDAAKDHASENNKWIVVNLQDNEEFGSYQLNRDTWSDESVQTMLQTFFVFWQSYNNVEAGRRVCSFYKLERFPAVLVVDPVTGACLAQWTGFVPPQQFIEKLEPFIEMSPEDGGAVQSALKRKHGQQMAGPQQKASGRPMTEDEEMALAMQMSMNEAQGGGGGAAGPSGGAAMDADTSLIDAEEEPAGPSADEMIATALKSLPDEPEATDPEAARIAVRLPDGQRLQRRFPKSCPVKALYAFCIISVAEAADGRPFALKPAHPGAEPLSDQSQTLAAAGVAGAMVVMGWTD